MPSQVPPQSEPSEPQEVRAPTGLPETAEQVPPLPGTLQAWHWPSQEVSQQRPSEAMPLEHCVGLPVGAPLGSFGAQTPAEQKSPPGQSESAVQPPAHMPEEPQVLGAQLWVWTAGQAPSPSQVADKVAVPLVQVASRQTIPEPG